MLQDASTNKRNRSKTIKVSQRHLSAVGSLVVLQKWMPQVLPSIEFDYISLDRQCSLFLSRLHEKLTPGRGSGSLRNNLSVCGMVIEALHDREHRNNDPEAIGCIAPLVLSAEMFKEFIDKEANVVPTYEAFAPITFKLEEVSPDVV
jgi:hypothetical protein